MTNYSNVYIDGDYFERLKNSLVGFANVNVKRFIINVSRLIDAELKRIYYFHSLPFYDPANHKESEKTKFDNKHRYFEALKNDNINVVLGHIQRRGFDKDNNPIDVQKGVDIAFTMSLLTDVFHKAINTAVLITGDNDFVPLIEKVKSFGTQVYVVSADKIDGTHILGNRIKKSVDKIIKINETHLVS